MLFRITLVIALAASLNPANAEEASPLDLPIFDELDRVVVSATLNARAQTDVASEVTVIDALQIDQRQMQAIVISSATSPASAYRQRRRRRTFRDRRFPDPRPRRKPRPGRSGRHRGP